MYGAKAASKRKTFGEHGRSAMDRLFGKPKEKAPRATMEGVTEAMEKRGEKQDDRIMKLDKELARYTQQLKTMKPGPAKQQVQKRAMAILKQKKMYENQREQTRNQQFNVDQVMFATENLKETADTVDAMKDANKALKKQFKAININQVEDMQDDMADLLEQAEEIQSAMGRSYNTDDIDEADLEAELAAMEDDPSLFLSTAGEGESLGAADYLELPATSEAPVEAAADTPSAVPQAAT